MICMEIEMQTAKREMYKMTIIVWAFYGVLQALGSEGVVIRRQHKYLANMGKQNRGYRFLPVINLSRKSVSNMSHWHAIS